jgi:hypothetical protein
MTWTRSEPSMKRVVAWQRLDTPGIEYAEVTIRPLCIEGEVVLFDEGAASAISYRVECDDAGVTSRAIVLVKREGALAVRTLVRDGAGIWSVDGLVTPELDGAFDVDVAITPSTNTLPIRRLGLAIGQRAEVTAAWVQFPSLEVVPLRQSYRRLDRERYEYEAPDHAFRAALTLDPDGVVQTYGALWTRLG